MNTNINNEFFVKFRSFEDKLDKAVVEYFRKEYGHDSLRVSPVSDQATRDLSSGKIVSVHTEFKIVGINATFLVQS